MSRALADVILERASHPEKGYTERHDDEHTGFELTSAAITYLICTLADGVSPNKARDEWWPWDDEEYKPRGDRENLVRAAALIIAEIERIDRAR